MNKNDSVSLAIQSKPNIVKDVLMGLVSSIGTGIMVSIAMMIVVFAFSSYVYADIPDTGLYQRIEIKKSEVQRGSLLFRSNGSDTYYLAPTVKTDVQFHISGMVARARVIQTFTNPDDAWIEGIYVFPLPENSAVDHMRMKIGERIIEGEIREREEAKRIYEKAKKSGKKASLIEQERPNLFTNSVANIGPYETIIIEIEYQQSLTYEKVNGTGQFQLRFPTTFTPRYIPGNPVNQVQNETIKTFSGNGWAANTDQVPDASRISPPFREYGDWSNPISLKVNLDAGFPVNRITSPYHEIQTTYLSEGLYLVELATDSVPANRDFNLVWQIDSGNAPRAALFNQSINGENYHLFMVMPPADGIGGTQHLAREVIYVIDTSGSMSGASIGQAREGLKMALQRLRNFDLFNIIEFNSRYTMLFDSAQQATRNNIHRAVNFVDSLNADGGTEMLPALTAALSGDQRDDLVQQVIFLTDGSIGNETELFKLINKSLGKRRLFTVGIGSAPNSYFMSKAAESGRGTYTYIGNINEVQQKMRELFSKLESPVMTNIDIKWPANVQLEVWPKRLPDLYLGEPLIVSAKSSAFDGEITVSGNRENIQWQVNLPLRGGQDNGGIAALWARNKISSLMDSIVEGADRETVKKNIVSVAMQHHLVSKFTSLVAVDKTPSRTREMLEKRNIANNLPQGSHFGRVSTLYAKAATSAQLKIMIGLLLLPLVIVMFLINRRNGARA